MPGNPLDSARARIGHGCDVIMLIYNYHSDNVMAEMRRHFMANAGSPGAEEGIDIVDEHGHAQQVKRAVDALRALNDVPSGTNVNVTDDEMEFVMQRLQPNKAAGPDGIRNETILHGGAALRNSLQLLFSLCLQWRTVPTEWQRAAITPLFKASSDKAADAAVRRYLAECYRGISLTSVVAKAFECVLLLRTRAQLKRPTHIDWRPIIRPSHVVESQGWISSGGGVLTCVPHRRSPWPIRFCGYDFVASLRWVQ